MTAKLSAACFLLGKRAVKQMSAEYLLSGKACKERRRGAYIKYVSGNATTHNKAWRRHENKSGASEQIKKVILSPPI